MLGGMCPQCFAPILERRITKDLRQKLTKADQVVVVVNDGSAQGVVLEYLLRKMLEDSRREIIIASAVGSVDFSKADKVFLSTTLEEFVSGALKSIFTTGSLDGAQGKTVELLRETSEEELVFLASFRKRAYRAGVSHKFMPLEDLEKKYPNSKANLAKSLSAN